MKTFIAETWLGAVVLFILGMMGYQFYERAIHSPREALGIIVFMLGVGMTLWSIWHLENNSKDK